MLKGGALLFAIAISLIVALICLSLILLSSYLRLHTSQYQEFDKLRINSISGINLLLSQYEVPQNKLVQIDLYGENTDTVELYKSHWGIFDLISSRAISKNNYFSQTAIEGCELEQKNRFALYLADSDKPLSVCGKTIISGKSYLPKAGVKRAYIEGQYFSGDKLIDGEVSNSKRMVPPLDKELLQRLSFNYKEYPSQSEPHRVSELFSNDSLVNSFTGTAMIFYEHGSVQLHRGLISGNIIITSDNSIRVGSDTRLQDVILAAPRVIVEENFHGTCQIIATEEVKIGENCILNYPSAISLCYKEDIDTIPIIHIEKGAAINGVIISVVSEPSSNGVISKIIIEKGAQVNGQVYSSTSVDLQGSIQGSLICRNIVLSTPSSVYENYLLNATVDITKLSKYFTGINIGDIYSSKKIIKWLY